MPDCGCEMDLKLQSDYPTMRIIDSLSVSQARGRRRVIKQGTMEEVAQIRQVQLLDLAACDKLLDATANLALWKRSKTVSPVGGLQVDEAVRQSEGVFEWEHPVVFSTVRTSISERTWELIPNARDTFRISPLQLVRYSTGGHYSHHRDSDPSVPSIATRVVSVVCYLNDDYSGGGTEFPNLGFTMKPIKGTAIAFPSHYVHAGTTVERGEKYILTFYLLGASRSQ